MQIFSTFTLPKIQGTSKIKPYPSLAPVSEQKPTSSYTQDQVDRSLAANPRAGLRNLPENTFAPLAGINPTGQPGGTTKPAAVTSTLFDLSTDPVVQRIRALNTQDYSTAVGKADEARKQLLIGAGLPDLARAAQYGSLEQPTTGDQTTALAAEQNPFSLARQLAQTHQGNEQTIDRTRGRQNLLYSSTRANDLAQEGSSYLGQQATLQDQVRAQLAAIIDQLGAARQSELQREADALSTARQNAITNALASGLVLVGFDQNGNPILRSLNDAPGSDAPPPAPEQPAVPATAAAGGPGATNAYRDAIASGVDPVTARYLAKLATIQL